MCVTSKMNINQKVIKIIKIYMIITSQITLPMCMIANEAKLKLP